MVRRLVEDAHGSASTLDPVVPDPPTPRALIGPHAGYPYSGPTAAAGYARLQALRGAIQRVVLLGPSHYVPLDRIALPRATALETPLGTLAVDPAMRAEALSQPGVVEADGPHAREHCLEVHLPFVQETLGDVTVLPLVVGNTAPEAAGNLIERFWDDETLIIVSTDLSHFHDQETALERDRETARYIEAAEFEHIGPQRACGAYALQGLLRVVRRHERPVETVAMTTSAEATGDYSRVVGYGAYVVH